MCINKNKIIITIVTKQKIKQRIKQDNTYKQKY